MIHEFLKNIFLLQQTEHSHDNGKAYIVEVQGADSTDDWQTR